MTIAMNGLAVYALVIATNILFHREAVRFLETHAAITDKASLEAFKNLARRNMKAVFPLIGAFIVGMTLTARLIIHYPLIGFTTFLLINVLLVSSALALNKVERWARELPCPDPALASEYQRISQSWLSDLWPGF